MVMSTLAWATAILGIRAGNRLPPHLGTGRRHIAGAAAGHLAAAELQSSVGANPPDSTYRRRRVQCG
jgi:hypothetical protein